MIKTFISRAAIFVAACLSLFMVSCVQEEYKISEEAINLELTVFQEGIALPLGSTSPFKIGAILDQYASDEIKKAIEPLKNRVEEVDFYPDMPGQPRRSDYGTFYDFAPPQNPF